MWLRQRRRALDMTQEDLAEAVGCSTVTIQKIELGERRPSKQIAQRLAECLRLPPDEHEHFIGFARGEAGVSELHLSTGGPSAQTTDEMTPTPLLATPNNLPTPLTPLLGRETALDTACGYLLSLDVRLLTLTGVPGIGKTRLSLAVAARMLPEFRDGLFFVELASINEPDLVASAVATTLGCKDIGGGSHLDWLKQFIGNQKLLLVLDNFEQILDAAPVVVELLRACPALKILVTSREALHVLGEQQLPVQPLEMPDFSRLPDTQYSQALLHYPAVALFVQRASAVDPGFGLTAENYRTVAAICARLEALPLAIELAAARINTLTPADLFSHLDKRLKLLTGGPRHLPARLQTLRGAIDWSYRLLSPTEQSLFACLGVFVGGATLDAIQAVYNDHGDGAGVEVLEGVGSLVDKSLLRREGSRSRFAMLEMIREYATEKLLESGEAVARRRAHALYFLQFAEQASLKTWGIGEPYWLDRLEEEHDNLRAALHWCSGAENGSAGIEMGLRLAGAMGRFWEVRGYLSEGRERIHAVISRAGAGDEQVRSARAWALVQAGALAFWQCDYQAVRLALEEALSIFRELDDRVGIARTLVDLSDVSREEGDYNTAIQLSEQALSMCKELGDTHGIALSLTMTAWAKMRPGYYREATEHLEEALALARELHIPNRVGLTLAGLGELLVRQGEYERSIPLLEESLEIRKAVGYKWGIAASLGTLGWAVLRQGDGQRATELVLESLILRNELGDKGGVAWCLEKLVEIEIAEGNALRAARYIGAARALRENIHIQIDIANRPDFEQTLNAVRNALGEQAFEIACAEGGSMTFEQAVSYALGAYEMLEEEI